jgi:tetratricopeptide (TPR) repeat protein
MTEILEIENLELRLFLDKYDLKYNLSYKKYQDVIYDIFINNNIKETKDHYILNIIGEYYYYVKKDYEQSVKYFFESINQGNNSDAMYNLGNYYYIIKKDYEQMEKYYLMSIQFNNPYAVNNLGCYYFDKKDYIQMKKYYQAAVELNNPAIMNNLGYYYQHIEKDYEQMKKYYQLAINLNDSSAMNNLAHYYFIEKDYEQMKKYYNLAIQFNNETSMYNLGDYYQNIEKNYIEAIKYIIMLIKLNNIKGIKLFNIIKQNINLIEFYNQVSCIKEKNEQINQLINYLSNIKIIHIYKNKLTYSKNNNVKADCPICLEKDKLALLYDCMHSVCSDCYPTYSDCTICKFDN